MKDLTKDNISKIKYEDTVAIFVAEGGAMVNQMLFMQS